LLRLFADNMRRIRKSKDLSQEALADLCDLDRTYISGIERKRRNLSIRNIQRIAEALGVDPRVLLEPVAS
jgi:transcriptional regulator with XRE-family HTH domain